MKRLVLASIAAAGLLVVTACDKKAEPEKAAANQDSEKAGGEADAPPKKEDRPAVAKNPHAGMGTNPHMAGMNMPKPVKRGPPREVTPSGELEVAAVEDIQMSVPKEWEKHDVSSPMRKAQYMLPGPGGDAELVVYRFPGGGGSFDKNLDRWLAQVEQPDGSATKDKANVEEKTVGDFTIKQVDVTGKFKAPNMPGAPKGEDIEEARVWAVMVEGSGDPYYLKVVGPAKTMDLWADAWAKALDTVAAKAG